MLQRGDPWAHVTLLESLAVITFFCANNKEETECAMQIIWGFVLAESGFDVSARKQAPPIISAAISSWSFLLTTLAGWEINHKRWRGATSRLLNMLKADYESFYDATGEALAMIFDSESLDKFSREFEDFSTSENAEFPLKYSKRKNVIKNSILKQLEELSIKPKREVHKQAFSNAVRADWNVLKYFKDDSFPQTLVRIYGHKLTLSSWSQMIQMKFLKNFLGEEEFAERLLENKLFHCLFEFAPIREENPDQELYESTMEKIAPVAFVPKEQDSDLLSRKENKQGRLWRNSIIDKPKTKVMNKTRKFAQEWKGQMYQIESEL